MSEENEEEEVECEELVYGMQMPCLPEGLQPLECVVLIEGIQMSTGQPTITAMGSEGMRPWVAVGMLRMEAFRLEQSYASLGDSGDFYDDEDEEDEDG